MVGLADARTSAPVATRVAAAASVDIGCTSCRDSTAVLPWFDRGSPSPAADRTSLVKGPRYIVEASGEDRRHLVGTGGGLGRGCGPVGQGGTGGGGVGEVVGGGSAGGAVVEEAVPLALVVAWQW